MKPVESETTSCRFAFGENWQRYLRVVNEERVGDAGRYLLQRLQLPSLQGLSFVDIGSGSGLMSLAARRLGASVHSIDYDIASVECARMLKEKFAPGDAKWTIDRGDALDAASLAALGRFDVVYSWGVLHHTGDMWRGLGNVMTLVRPGGLLYIAIYNDQGRWSRGWRRVKRAYNACPPAMRWAILLPALVVTWGPSFVRDLVRLRPLKSWRDYDRDRGMHPWSDLKDWVGGYPFEVARPEEIFDFCFKRGFSLQSLKTCGGGLGCNEFVFRADRVPAA